MDDAKQQDGNRPSDADEVTEHTSSSQGAPPSGDAQSNETQSGGVESSIESGDTPPDTSRSPQDAPPSSEAQSKDEEIAALREQLMRAQAEFENAEKRRAREAKQIRKYLMESFVLELLEVKDNLERAMEALENAAGEDDDTRSGLRLTVEHFSRVLTQNHVEEIAAQGEVFNPESHEAMHMQSSEEHPANTIIQTIQKGYRMHERLLRPARVIVSSGKAQAEAQAGDAAKGQAAASNGEAERARDAKADAKEDAQ